jgi:hypothetical protein
MSDQIWDEDVDAQELDEEYEHQRSDMDFHFFQCVDASF